jgi:hypothetical protein
MTGTTALPVELVNELNTLFVKLGTTQREWQDAIGFGEEGHRLRIDAGAYWDDGSVFHRHALDALRNYYMVKLGLIMTESSEAFDEMRKHAIDERYYSVDEQGHQKPEGVLSELADIQIRIWSLMGETNLSAELVDAIAEKLEYNRTRAQRHGGKAI